MEAHVLRRFHPCGRRELHEIGSLPDEAYACLRAAEGLLAAGEREQGQEQLGRGLEFWRSVGAAAYVREGEALLPEVGRPS